MDEQHLDLVPDEMVLAQLIGVPGMDATTLDGLADEEFTGVIEAAQRIIARRAATARIPDRKSVV